MKIKPKTHEHKKIQNEYPSIPQMSCYGISKIICDLKDFFFFSVSTDIDIIYCVERVHDTVGQANPSSDFLVRLTNVIQYTAKVCKTLGDLDVLATCMNTLDCIIQQVSKLLDPGFRPEDLQSQRLRLLMQHFESQHQDLQQFHEKYSIISKNKVSDLYVANICSTTTLINNCASYPVLASTEK